MCQIRYNEAVACLQHRHMTSGWSPKNKVFTHYAMTTFKFSEVYLCMCACYLLMLSTGRGRIQTSRLPGKLRFKHSPM